MKDEYKIVIDTEEYGYLGIHAVRSIYNKVVLIANRVICGDARVEFINDVKDTLFTDNPKTITYKDVIYNGIDWMYVEIHESNHINIIRVKTYCYNEDKKQVRIIPY